MEVSSTTLKSSIDYSDADDRGDVSDRVVVPAHHQLLQMSERDCFLKVRHIDFLPAITVFTSTLSRYANVHTFIVLVISILSILVLYNAVTDNIVLCNSRLDCNPI